MSSSAYLGIDVGGTGAKAGVFDASGRMLGFGRRTFAPISPAQGLIEIDIEQIYQGAKESAAEAVAASGAEVRAFAISSQGQTFVSLDAADRPLHNAIIWYDSRASEQADQMLAEIKARRVENPPFVEAIATAPKIMWLRERDPATMARAVRYLTLPDYFYYRLTGEAVTDPSTATTTALYAEDAPGYCAEALAAAQIEESQVAVIRPSGAPIAHVRQDVASEWGMSPNTLAVVGTNDQYAGALGAGNCRPGIVSETSGTCLALITLVETPPENLPDGLWLGRFPITRYQFVLAYAKTCGVVLDWFRRELGANRSLQELDALAEDVPIGSKGITVLPHFEGVFSPHPDPSVRGCIANLTLSHTSADIYRAILESLAFCLRQYLEVMQDCGIICNDVRCIGGGAKSQLWLQIKADVIGKPVSRPAVTEAAVLGAAALAASGVGDFPSIEDAASTFYRPGLVFNPNPEHTQDYQAPYEAFLTLWQKLYSVTQSS